MTGLCHKELVKIKETTYVFIYFAAHRRLKASHADETLSGFSTTLETAVA